MDDKVSIQELEKVEGEWISNPSPILCARFADLLRRMGRLDESRKVAEKGLNRWEKNTSIEVVLGKCYLDSGLLEKAMEKFSEVHSVQPQNLVALRNLAEIHFRKENWDASIGYFEEYLYEHSGDDEARDRLEEAKSRKNSGSEETVDIGEDMLDTDDSVFPNTERMNRVLESQGIDAGDSDDSEVMDTDDKSVVMEAFIENDSPGSLMDLFSDDEKKELKLESYYGEDE